MKMFKKIMAVVLTGALAVSMLTGCAISDKLAGDAFLSQMKAAGKGNAIETTYVKGTKANNKDATNGKVEYKLDKALTSAKAVVKAEAAKTTEDGIAAAVQAAVQAKPITDGTSSKAAVVFVTKLPSSATNKDNWFDTAARLNTALFGEKSTAAEPNKEGAYKKITGTTTKKAEITINYEVVEYKTLKEAGKTATKDVRYLVAVAAPSTVND